MNWRLVTAINALIALVTVGAVIFDLTRRRTEHSRAERQHTASQSSASRNQPEQRIEKVHLQSVDDLANARADDLGAVPAAELTELMHRASREQLTAMALKFNEAPTDARTFGGMAVFFQQWAQLDPHSAMAASFRINDVAMRKLAARTVVSAVSPYAAAELIGILAEHPDKDLADECNGEFLNTLITSWSDLDPEAAARYIDQLPETQNSSDHFGTKGDVAYNWATLDPFAALEWAAMQKKEIGSYDPSQLYNNAIKGWCRKDFATASAYVAQHFNDPNIAATAPFVAAALFDQNADAATGWITQLPTGEPRQQAESRLVAMWSAKDPASAANWIANLSGDEQANVADIIARNWINTSWTDASHWINTLTGDVRDQALAAAVDREGATPYESLTTALSIANGEKRNSIVENQIRTWAATDANAAETWLKGSALSKEEKEYLRSVIAETQKNAAEVERVTTD